MEILIAIAGKVVDCMVESVKQWLCYSIHYNNNIESMKKQVEKLRDARDRVQHSVDAATRNGEEIEGDVKNWLKEADGIIELVRKDFEDEEEEKRKCCNGTFLNLKLRHQLSQKAKKIVQDIAKALEIGKFDKVSYHPPQHGIVTTRCRDYVDSESRMSTLKRLMEALRDDNIHLIGVWGMAGVGKTTLVREVANQAKQEIFFDEVPIVNVTETPDHKQIQKDIAYELGLQLDVESSVTGRAIRLRERLTKRKDKKMILVILDDIWEYLDLEKIGIPSEGCKVLLTSRNRDVLVQAMSTEKDFGLEVLGEEEAWSLFEKMAGDCVNKDNMRSTATEVAKACAGLPLALVTVSKALKNKSLNEWKDALQLLRRPATGNLPRMQSTIYSSIELSYSHLESEEVKYFFLRCAQMGFSIYYKDLLKYCYGLGSFHGINTLEEARNRLDRLVGNLKDSCLLLDCPDHGSKEFHMHMHSVVRHVARLIASKDHNMITVREDDGLKERLDIDLLKSCKEFSISGGDFHELPNGVEFCPELRFLHVYGGDRPLQISDTFFEGMGKLQVLDFTEMQLPALPSSLGLLRNLQTLCLDQCVLGDIAVIGELKNLVILSLMNSNISQLPREIGFLTHLRLLDLSDCSKLEVIPPNVLSRLEALEELYMGNNFVQWEAEKLNNASLVELKHLSHLTTLEIDIRDASNLPKDLLFKKLERYVIFVGDVWDRSYKCEVSKTLKLKLNESFQSKVGIKMLLKRTESLYLDELKGVKSVLNELNREGFQQLKHLHIQNNAEIKCIINSSTLMDIAFPALESILLKNMTGLEEICHGQLPSHLTSFGNLRAIKVEHCDKLEFVFSSSIARGLSQLEELEIRECNIMGSIVMKEEGEIEDEHTLNLFPKLRRLALDHLPKFMSFLSTQNSLVTDARGIISKGKPPYSHMPILHEQVVFPNLECLKLSSIGLEDIQHNQHQATSSSCILANMQSTSKFQNLLHLQVKGSNNIKYLLSFSTAKFMVQLKHLHIWKCMVMEEILVTEETIHMVLFPQLECLLLKELPVLKRFCEGSNIKLPFLKNLVIQNCPKLKTFVSKPISSDTTTSKEFKEMNAEESPHTSTQPLFNEEVAFPILERLVISHMDDLKIIWQNQFVVDSFNKLQDIEVEFCENLLNIFQSDMLSSFQNLQLVHVVGCRSLKSLFPAFVARRLTRLKQLVIVGCELEEIVAREETAPPIACFVFPQVNVLHLAILPRLKWFYPGNHTSEWPKLKDMLVAWCPKVEILASEHLSFEDILPESKLQMPPKHPLFLVDEVRTKEP